MLSGDELAAQHAVIMVAFINYMVLTSQSVTLQIRLKSFFKKKLLSISVFILSDS